MSDKQVKVAIEGPVAVMTVSRPDRLNALDLDMIEPLAHTAHLYLFVNVRSGTPAFGWCRWHRLAMTIQSESRE